MGKIYKIIGLLVIATLMFVGCSSDDSKVKPPEVKGNTQVETGGKLEEAENFGKGIKSKILKDFMNTKQYTMKIRQTTDFNGMEMVALLTNVVDGDRTYSHLEMNGNIIEHIEIDDKSYSIMRDSKTIIKTDRYNEDEPDNANMPLGYEDLEYVGSGNEMFLGNKRDYEEYKIDLGIVKYYFNGKDLDGMKMIFDMEKLREDGDEGDYPTGDATIIMEVLSYEKVVDKSVFELPKDYTIYGN